MSYPPIGFVYLIANDSMPGLYKIGYTERAPSARVRELSKSTSNPTEFILLVYAEHEDPRNLEATIHQRLSEKRVNNGKEFFRLDLSDLYSVISIIKECAISYADVDVDAHLWELSKAHLDKQPMVESL